MVTDSLLNDLQVSATNRLLEALVESENRMRQRVDLLAEVVFELDSQGNIVFLNRACESMMGVPVEALMGKNLRIQLLPADRPLYDTALSKAGRTVEGRRTVVRFQRDGGALLWAELSLVLIDSGHVGALHDITEQMRIQDQLEYIARYDMLTRMPNRTLLSDRLRQSMASCKRHGNSLAVAFLDLDGFKAINDTHGHDAGDQLLAGLAARMRLALRDGDTIARIGGDEFVAVLVDLDHAQQSEPILQRLLEAAAEPVPVGDLTLKVSASIGVTICPQDSADADQLIRHADQAMYIAKQLGKNRVHFFDIANDSAVRAHGETLERIQNGLLHNEFVLFYQPKVNMRTGSVFGVEALIRWQHPEHGLLLPGTFLPMIENHPLSVNLGEWVIVTALQQMAQWKLIGIDLEVSVNIGAYQLQRERFSVRVGELLSSQPQIRRGGLTFEILETSALGDIDYISRVIQECQAQGISFSLDDFGTGYSSLTYLKHLPAETLKIDRSFVRDMLTDRDDLAIVKGVIALAKAFRRKVIAEGVETPEHLKRLQRLGCDAAQGFGIARPMPADAVPDWVLLHGLPSNTAA